jgi:hypothetical protein
MHYHRIISQPTPTCSIAQPMNVTRNAVSLVGMSGRQSCARLFLVEFLDTDPLAVRVPVHQPAVEPATHAHSTVWLDHDHSDSLHSVQKRCASNVLVKRFGDLYAKVARAVTGMLKEPSSPFVGVIPVWSLHLASTFHS